MSCGEGSSVAVSCGEGHRCSLDPVLLWLWRRPAATAPIPPLVWEHPYALRAAQKTQNKTKSLVERRVQTADVNEEAVRVWKVLKATRPETCQTSEERKKQLENWIRDTSTFRGEEAEGKPAKDKDVCVCWGRRKSRECGVLETQGVKNFKEERRQVKHHETWRIIRLNCTVLRGKLKVHVKL